MRLGRVFLFFLMQVSVLVGGTVTYSYSGNPFRTAIAPYDTSEAVTISVTLNNALPADQALTNVTSAVTSFSLFDGVNPINSSNAESDLFELGTTAGSISAWYIGVSSNGGANQIYSCGNAVNLCFPPTYDAGSMPGSYGYVQNAPGTWVGQTAVPEPTTAAMLLAGGMAAAGLRVMRTGNRRKG